MTDNFKLRWGRVGKGLWFGAIVLTVAVIVVYRLKTLSDTHHNIEMRDLILGERGKSWDPCHFGDAGDWVYKTMTQEDGEQVCKCNSSDCCVCY